MSPKYFCYFCETICCHEIVKIAQSGHTDYNEKIIGSCFSFIVTQVADFQTGRIKEWR